MPETTNVQTTFDVCFSIFETLNSRADSFLSSLLGMSRARIQKNIARENLSVNGIVITKNSFNKFKKGELVEFEVEPLEQISVLPEKIELNIVFENDLFIIIDKPAGMVVHPGAGHFSGTLVNGVVFYLQNNFHLSAEPENIRPGLVHRIDKDTSGLLVIAKTEKAFEELSDRFSKHDIEREYSCLVWGKLKTSKGTIETPHGRDPNNRLRFSPNVRNGRKAVTHFEVIAEYKYASLIKVNLETGRTHQIRMHMSHIGHPIVNDVLYGNSRKTPDPVLNKKLGLFDRQFLHAGKLGFSISGNKYMFNSQLPPDINEILKYLEKISGS